MIIRNLYIQYVCFCIKRSNVMNKCMRHLESHLRPRSVAITKYINKYNMSYFVCGSMILRKASSKMNIR